MPDGRDERLVRQHYGSGDLGDAILDVLRAAGIDVDHLTVNDLAPIDQFHPGGRPVTKGLIQFARLADAGPCDILDVGGGIGGPARMLASELGAQVTVLELTDEFCRVGEMLTERTHLSDRVRCQQGSALDMPFPDHSFNVVWLQSAAMNIEDKERLYAEIYRVLRRRGRLVIQDTAAGPNQPVRYPVPWALGPEISFLSTPEETYALLRRTGLTVAALSEAPDQLLVGLRKPRERSTPRKPRLPELGEIRFSKEFWDQAISNMLCNVAEGRTINLWVVADRCDREEASDAN